MFSWPGLPFGGLVSLRQTELRNFLAEELERDSAKLEMNTSKPERIEHLEFFLIIYHDVFFFSIFLNLSLYHITRSNYLHAKYHPICPAFSKVLMTCTPSASACFASPTSQPTSERCWRFPALSAWGSIYPLRR